MLQVTEEYTEFWICAPKISERVVTIRTCSTLVNSFLGKRGDTDYMANHEDSIGLVSVNSGDGGCL